MPGTPPIPSAAHSTSSPVTRPAIEAERRGYYRDTAPLAAQSLREVLQAHFHREFRPQDIWNTLVNTRTYAGRELHDLCEAACPNGPLFLEMVTLLMLPEADRSLDRLSDAGVFLIPTRDLSPSLDASALLRSDKGLMLWLQYAATPTGYLNLFDASDIFGEPDDENTARIDKALQVMVACGRDRTDARPSSMTRTLPDNPLVHLCSQIAPQWLRRLLEIGASPNQTNRHGMPLTVIAMRAQALRLHCAGEDPLHPHVSLSQLARLLRHYGGDLMQPNRHGAPAGVMLAMLGLCGAVEALLLAGADPNAPDRHGNTFMHHLGIIARARDTAAKRDNANLALYSIAVAARHHGDLTRRNLAGHTPLSWMPDAQGTPPPISPEFIDAVRRTALRRIGGPAL